MKLFRSGLIIAAFAAVSPTVQALCDPGETLIRFSHETNTDRHPKGIAATLLAARVNDEMNGMACMQVYPQAALHDDKAVV